MLLLHFRRSFVIVLGAIPEAFLKFALLIFLSINNFHKRSYDTAMIASWHLFNALYAVHNKYIITSYFSQELAIFIDTYICFSYSSMPLDWFFNFLLFFLFFHFLPVLFQSLFNILFLLLYAHFYMFCSWHGLHVHPAKGQKISCFYSIARLSQL